MAFKMKAGKEGPMKKNFPSAFKKDDGKKKKSKADIELDSLLTPASQDTMEFKTSPGFVDYLKRNDFTSFITNISRDLASMERDLSTLSVDWLSLRLQYCVSSLMLAHYLICQQVLKLVVSALRVMTRPLCRASSGMWMFRVGLSVIRLRSSLTKSRQAYSTRYLETLSKRVAELDR